MNPHSETAAKIAEIERKYAHLLSRVDSITTHTLKLTGQIESLETRILALASTASSAAQSNELLQRILFNQTDVLDQLDEIKKTVNPLKHMTIDESVSPPSDPPF